MEMYCECGMLLVTEEEVENGRCVYCYNSNEDEYCEICGEELDSDDIGNFICKACYEDV